jgi:hypothetical protein
VARPPISIYRNAKFSMRGAEGLASCRSSQTVETGGGGRSSAEAAVSGGRLASTVTVALQESS